MKHTRGPWRLEGDRIEADDGQGPVLVATVRRTQGHDAEVAANGALLAAAPELLDELLRADVVIQIMLWLMTAEQKAHMAEMLEASLIAGEGATRYHERRAVIERATAPKAHGKR